MKIDRISLSSHEAIWFARNILKTIVHSENQAQKHPELLERNTYRTLKKIEDQAKSLVQDLDRTQFSPEHSYEIFLSRKQKLVVRELVENTNKLLESMIVPEYQKRTQADTETYGPYLKDAQNKIVLLKSIARKLK
jgi:hypothetical protein